MNNTGNAENTVKRSLSWPCALAQGGLRDPIGSSVFSSEAAFQDSLEAAALGNDTKSRLALKARYKI
jgi:hypothetical protein